MKDPTKGGTARLDRDNGRRKCLKGCMKSEQHLVTGLQGREGAEGAGGCDALGGCSQVWAQSIGGEAELCAEQEPSANASL